MAEKRSTADDAATAVPNTRTEEPDQSAPARKHTTKATKAAASAADPAAAGAAKKPAKGTRSTKATKATKSASKSSKSAESAESAEPSRVTGAAEQPAGEPVTKAAKAAKSPARRPAKRTDSPATVPAPRTEPPAGQEDSPTALPGPPVAPVEPAPPGGAAGPATPGAWTAAIWAAVQEPSQPPRRLAELVVAELGPRAAAWASWLLATYPDPPAHGLVRLAAHQAGRFGWPLALAGATRPVAASVTLPVTAWVRASVVLRIAAAYGHDPTDPRRVDELLELLGLAEPVGAGPPKLGRVTGLAGRLGLTRFALSRLGLRRTPAARAVRILTAAADHHESVERLAHRAARHYRPKAASI